MLTLSGGMRFTAGGKERKRKEIHDQGAEFADRE